MSMNNENYDISFTELRTKDVINAGDGRRLGKIIDLVFSSETAKVRGIVAPYAKRTLLSKGQDVFIPWRCVKKIGEDVIIVDINNVQQQGDGVVADCGDGTPNKKPSAPDCDRKCEKCMLFDCEHRWKR